MTSHSNFSYRSALTNLLWKRRMLFLFGTSPPNFRLQIFWKASRETASEPAPHHLGDHKCPRGTRVAKSAKDSCKDQSCWRKFQSADARVWPSSAPPPPRSSFAGWGTQGRRWLRKVQVGWKMAFAWTKFSKIWTHWESRSYAEVFHC